MRHPNSQGPNLSLATRTARFLVKLAQHKSASGVLLIATTIVALIWANSPSSQVYHDLWRVKFTAGLPQAGLTMSLHHWINDGLMAVFFLAVGLEIKREIVMGELSSFQHAVLPAVGALGGMLVPASIFYLLTSGTPASAGWGIPMATDIAFALGVVALLGDKVPTSLKVFLAALAIADDMGAVLVIALFYTSSLNISALLVAAALLALLITFNRAGAKHAAFYVLPGIALWGATMASGIHATIAGVLLAATIPARVVGVLKVDDQGNQSPLHRMEHRLAGVVPFVIMPLFAFANAGVTFGNNVASLVSQPVVPAILLGLFVGKTVGIFGAAFIAIKLRLASMPRGAAWHHFVGVAMLGGIGFTMSLFIAGLAFSDPLLLDASKLGIFGGSLLSAVAGWAVLSFSSKRDRRVV